MAVSQQVAAGLVTVSILETLTLSWPARAVLGHVRVVLVYALLAGLIPLLLHLRELCDRLPYRELWKPLDGVRRALTAALAVLLLVPLLDALLGLAVGAGVVVGPPVGFSGGNLWGIYRTIRDVSQGIAMLVVLLAIVRLLGTVQKTGTPAGAPGAACRAALAASRSAQRGGLIACACVEAVCRVTTACGRRCALLKCVSAVCFRGIYNEENLD